MPLANVYAKPDWVLVSKRIDMLKNNVLWIKKVGVSGFELNVTEYKVTSFTLECFSSYYFLMSADNFSYIENELIILILSLIINSLY